MRRVGQARKRDANEPEIVAALERIGVQVFLVSGDGIPDLNTYDARRRAIWRGVRHMWLPVEVKRPRGKLTPSQASTKQRAPFPVVETVDQALALFGVRPIPAPEAAC